MKVSTFMITFFAGMSIAKPVPDSAYRVLAENPTQVNGEDEVDLLAARIGYKRAYQALAENPTQVNGEDEVDLLAARIGY